jgi:hypothetical protein
MKVLGFTQRKKLKRLKMNMFRVRVATITLGVFSDED